MVIGIFLFIVFLSLKIFFIIVLSWVVNCNYSLIRLIRIVVQIISYEIVIFVFFIFYFFVYLRLSFFVFNNSFIVFFFFGFFFFYLWLIVVMLEFGRIPFDFYEGESELVSGFNIEFGSFFVIVIFMFEYIDIILFGVVTISIYFYFFFFFILLIMFFFI